MSKICFIVGDKDIPKKIRSFILDIAGELINLGWTIRIRNTESPIDKEIIKTGGKIQAFNPKEDNTDTTIYLASRFHPYWSIFNQKEKNNACRDIGCVLGYDLRDPCAFIICYTSDGRPTGSSSFPMKIAKAWNVDVHNLYYEDSMQRLGSRFQRLYKGNV